MLADAWARKQSQCFQNPIKTEQLRPRHVQRFFRNMRPSNRLPVVSEHLHVCTYAARRWASSCRAGEGQVYAAESEWHTRGFSSCHCNAAVASANR